MTHSLLGHEINVVHYNRDCLPFQKIIYCFVREGEASIYCSTYLRNHWLILVCALTGGRTHNLGVSGENALAYEPPGQGSLTVLKVWL